MKRIIYGSLSVLTAISTAFVAAKAEVFNSQSDASVSQSELTAVNAGEANSLFELSNIDSNELLLGAKVPGSSLSPEGLSKGVLPDVDLSSKTRSGELNAGILNSNRLAQKPVPTQKTFRSTPSSAVNLPNRISTYTAQNTPLSTPQSIRQSIRQGTPQSTPQSQPRLSRQPTAVQSASQPSLITMPSAQAIAQAQTVPGADVNTLPAKIEMVPAANESPLVEPTVNQLTPTVTPEENAEIGVETESLVEEDSAAPEMTIEEAPAGITPATPLEPAADELAPMTPTNEQPTLGEPGLSEPGLTEPGLTEPGLTEPGLTEPGLTEPGLSEPGLNEPGLTDPGLTDPGISEPGLDEPDFDEALPPIQQDGATPVTPTPDAPGFPPATEPLPPLDEDSAAPSNDFPVGASSSDRLVGEGFTPFQLSYLAVAGGLEEEGIPGGTILLSAYEQGDISAEDIVDAGALSNRLGTAASDEADYTNGVDRILALLERDSRSSN